MLNNYTWSDYGIAVAVSIAGYYLILAALYYRSEIKDLLSGKVKFRANNISEDYNTPGEMDEAVWEEWEVFVDNLKSSVLAQAGTEVTKAELLAQLSSRVASYDGLRHPACRVAVNEFIVQHAQQSCGIAFSEREVEVAWAKLSR